PDICDRALNHWIGVANCFKRTSFLFRATGLQDGGCLNPAFSGRALCGYLAVSTRHSRNLLAGSWFRTLRFHGCGATQPAIGACALSYIHSKESRKVFIAEDLAG